MGKLILLKINLTMKMLDDLLIISRFLLNAAKAKFESDTGYIWNRAKIVH